MTLRERANKLKADIPSVFFALKKRETPMLAKICASFTIIYALSPIDVIPDFIPVLGYLDDVVILPGLVALTIRLIPQDVVTQCRSESQGVWQEGKPKKWYYALAVAGVWLVVLDLVAKAVWL